MYHSDKYKESNDSLERFCRAFNSVAADLGNDIIFQVSKVENFRDDGAVMHMKQKRKLLFDWEKRHSYYDTYGSFKFDTFGQFERKIRKPEILLSIQCSTDEKGFCIAWHEDFKKEQVVAIGSKTANGGREYDGKRFTKKFIEISYDNMDIFYRILQRAFQSNSFNSDSFNI